MATQKGPKPTAADMAKLNRKPVKMSKRAALAEKIKSLKKKK